MRALISVYDKTGVVEFATSLRKLGWDIISTGGTLQTLSNANIQAESVSSITEYPELLDGRVKTLHPAIHAGILARRSDGHHMSSLADHNILPIDMVVCNLYPFAKTIEAHPPEEAVSEQIDIGGPTMIRAAAKNFDNVIVLVDPHQYTKIIESLKSGSITPDERRDLAGSAFSHTAMYDSIIANYFLFSDRTQLPTNITVPLTQTTSLKYGENPHQEKAALYRFGSNETESSQLLSANQLHGPRLSYNNILDASSAYQLVNDFVEQCLAVIKHGNPCGLSIGDDQPKIWDQAFQADPISIFGGIVALNRPLTSTTALAMKDVMLDLIIAPDYEPDALAILKKRKRTRVIQIPNSVKTRDPFDNLVLRSVPGGMLVQQSDSKPDESTTFKVVSKRQPSANEFSDLKFAWRAVKHVRSNSIVVAKNRSLVGVGAGQMSRVDAVFLAMHRAGTNATGAVLASDAFFPFPDGPEIALKAGVRAIVEPGGSIRSDSVVELANRYEAVLVFTEGERHFQH